MLLQLEDDDTSVFITPASSAVVSEDVGDSSALKSDCLRVCLRASAANQYITGEEEQINRVSTCICGYERRHVQSQLSSFQYLSSKKEQAAAFHLVTVPSLYEGLH